MKLITKFKFLFLWKKDAVLEEGGKGKTTDLALACFLSIHDG